jgi:large subunit GTPase 1
LDRLEQESFLEWRRNIALREEHEFNKASQSNTPRVVTPFEKNLQVWRQLWRVLERCQVLVQILDARNPLFYLNQDLRQYVAGELKKPMLLLLNKSDFLTPLQRREWHVYLEAQGWDHVFFSAHVEQEKLDQQAVLERKQQQEQEDQSFLLEPKGIEEQAEHEDDDSDDDVDSDEDDDSDDEDSNQEQKEEEPEHSSLDSSDEPVVDDQDASRVEDHGVENLLTRAQLMQYLQDFAHQNGCGADGEEHVPIGMVGFPNVGKSSVINVLVGASKHTHGTVRVGVAAQPGKTKHFQTLFLPDRNDIMLCDCPGLVFPSFVSNTADLIAAGVYPISQMRDYWPVVELICQRIPRPVLEVHYGIKLPVNPDWKQGESIPPPTAEELLTTYCVTRSMLAASSGAPDYPRAARIVIKDYAIGRLLYCHIPPTLVDSRGIGAFETETLLNALQRTKKLRDKLLLQAKAQAKESGEEAKGNGGENDNIDDMEDILDFVKVTNASATVNGSNKETKSRKKKPITTKRGRQGRQEDPYGCGASPDDLLDENLAKNSGLVVNAGKYGRSGYTRPTSYAGPRSATTSTAPTPTV